MKNRKTGRPAMGAALTLCALLLGLAGCSSSSQSVTKNDSLYALEVRGMTGTDQHTLELNAGDALRVRMEAEEGSLSLEITGPDGAAVYQGSGGEAAQFTLTLPLDGVYTVSVAGRRARGSLRVEAEEREKEEAPEAPAAPEGEARDEATVTAADLVGPWHLAEGENDDAAVHGAFPGAMEFGGSMEITGDGRLSWYIGAEGGTGTYTLEGSRLSASLKRDSDGTDLPMEFTVEEKEGRLLLVTEYRDLTLRWSWGEGETGQGEA